MPLQKKYRTPLISTACRDTITIWIRFDSKQITGSFVPVNILFGHLLFLILSTITGYPHIRSPKEQPFFVQQILDL